MSKAPWLLLAGALLLCAAPVVSAAVCYDEDENVVADGSSAAVHCLPENFDKTSACFDEMPEGSLDKCPFYNVMNQAPIRLVKAEDASKSDPKDKFVWGYCTQSPFGSGNQALDSWLQEQIGTDANEWTQLCSSACSDVFKKAKECYEHIGRSVQLMDATELEEYEMFRTSCISGSASTSNMTPAKRSPIHEAEFFTKICDDCWDGNQVNTKCVTEVYIDTASSSAKTNNSHIAFSITAVFVALAVFFREY